MSISAPFYVYSNLFLLQARKEARVSKRKHMVEQLFDFWDVDRSGTLNFQEVIDVLSKWKDISAQAEFQECKYKQFEGGSRQCHYIRCVWSKPGFALLLFVVMNEHYTDVRELTCSELHEYIDSICTACFPHEDPFEAIVIFLHTSIEVITVILPRDPVRIIPCRDTLHTSPSFTLIVLVENVRGTEARRGKKVVVERHR